MNERDDPRVGIFVPTRNQSEFLIRQLEYYARVKSPHTVYIGDSSDEEQAQAIQRAIARLQSTIRIVYRFFPAAQYRIAACERELLAMVEEKYVVFNGDDDFHVPKALTSCAQFLAGHPEYSSAHGLGIAFHFVQEGVRGEVGGYGQYPLPLIEEETAASRLAHHFRHYSCTLFAVHRTTQMRAYWKLVDHLKDDLFAGEFLQSFLSVAEGKSKTINSLQLVRHGRQDKPRIRHLFQWVTSEQWRDSYIFFRDTLVQEIVRRDGVSFKQAQDVVEQGFLGLLIWLLEMQYEQRYLTTTPVKTLRQQFTRWFPFLRIIYRRAHRYLPLSHMSLAPFVSSYQDWRHLVNSFSK